MESDDWEKQFLNEIKEESGKLSSNNEAERLWGIAKLEERMHGYGISRTILEKLIDMIKTDDSEIVRIMAIRALYHPSSETWSFGPEDRKKIFKAIANSKCFITNEILDLERKNRWLRY